MKESAAKADDRGPLLTELESDEPTDVAAVRHAYIKCVPCQATGWIGVLVGPGVIDRRPCILCDGTGYQHTIAGRADLGNRGDKR
jgi:hypothetical protein